MHLETPEVLIGAAMLYVGARLFRKNAPWFTTRYETSLPYFLFAFICALPVFIVSILNNGRGEVVAYDVMGASFSAIILAGFALATGKMWATHRSNAYLDLLLVFFGVCSLDFIGYMVGLGFNEAMWMQCGLILLVLVMRYFRDRNDPCFIRYHSNRSVNDEGRDNVPRAVLFMGMHVLGVSLMIEALVCRVHYFTHIEQMVAMFYMAAVIALSQIAFANILRKRGSFNMSVVFCMGCIFWNTVLLLISTVMLDASYFV